MNYGDVPLTPERRGRLLRHARAETRPGDLLFFYHRTSWRSRWIRRITASDMPHVCVYLGKGRIIGMLRGRVRQHRLSRFFRDEYELRFVRGSPAILHEVTKFVGRRESALDLLVLALLVLLERAFAASGARKWFPYRMRGVTCSGIVASAWHRANGVEPRCEPMKYTPRDLEQVVGKLGFFEANLLPSTRSTPPVHGSVPLDSE